MKKVAILQSNYIPWKGYFDLINMVDEFILYDDMQYTKNDWRNRNKIKTPKGLQWLTIPVKSNFGQKINETIIFGNDWAKNHWLTIKQFYSRAKYFNEYKGPIENYYLTTGEQYLSRVNYELITIINKILDIKTKISWSDSFKLAEGKTERVVDLVSQVNGTEYISGPAAKDYIKEEFFAAANIKLTWMDYSGYPEYEQMYPPFEHGVTILDLIFNEGPNARAFMKKKL